MNRNILQPPADREISPQLGDYEREWDRFSLDLARAGLDGLSDGADVHDFQALLNRVSPDFRIEPTQPGDFALLHFTRGKPEDVNSALRYLGEKLRRGTAAAGAAPASP